MRIWFKYYQPRFKTADSPIPEQAMGLGGWVEPVRPTPSMIGLMRFKFLNYEYSLPDQGGWNNSFLDKLWLYNLHYFSDLTARDAFARGAWHQLLIVRWIKENPPGLGNGWESYPISLRIVNWIKWSLVGTTQPNFLLPNGFMQSLATQAHWLMNRLEWHLLGNHLFTNAKALVFAGLFFQGDEPKKWLRQGLKIISKELSEQVLNDGGHFERSPMYHAIFLDDMLDLINLAQAFPGPVDSKTIGRWRSVASKMLSWLNSMSHPDGQIALFNDAAFEIAPTITQLRSYAMRLDIAKSKVYDNKEFKTGFPISIRQLKDSGYIRLAAKKAVAILDIAPIGPDYLPGHAHADTLSFELSIFGQRVIVNGGTSRYGMSPDRLRERQTISHSTVEVNGQSSSEVWGGFRVARRAYPFDLAVSGDSIQAMVSCSHDGYRRLSGKPVHRRTWVFREDVIEVGDVILGSYSQAIARFIIHPDVVVSEIGKGIWQLKLPHGELITFAINSGVGQLEDAFYAPEFGKALETKCLAVNLYKASSSIQLRWN